MKKSKLLPLLLVVLMIFAVAVGCAPAEETPPPEQETPPPAAEEPPADTPTYADGEYRAEGERGERGWMPFIEITISGGEITSVTYDEEHEDGRLKSEDEDYNERWEEQAGVSAVEAYPALENSLIETQDIEQVETVTGATASYNDFVSVARIALEEAEDN
ncbi:FMN-binding protein [Alkaliphilus transvaalensis]|uniref:FMN-binding protein n=1 Tax=Alkaliphilus transvaalensis TaxID=114628 RepID=UPI0006879CCA|nr:FMN-binding protein [Alkaliphilus transvaalensis]